MSENSPRDYHQCTWRCSFKVLELFLLSPLQLYLSPSLSAPPFLKLSTTLKQTYSLQLPLSHPLIFLCNFFFFLVFPSSSFLCLSRENALQFFPETSSVSFCFLSLKPSKSLSLFFLASPPTLQPPKSSLQNSPLS